MESAKGGDISRSEASANLTRHESWRDKFAHIRHNCWRMHSLNLYLELFHLVNYLLFYIRIIGF